MRKQRFDKSCRFPTCSILSLLPFFVFLFIFGTRASATETQTNTKQLLPLTSKLETIDASAKYTRLKTQEKGRYAMVKVYALNMRSGPGKTFPVIKVLKKGAHLRAVAFKKSNWIKVRIPHGKEGWIARPYVKLYSPKPLPANLNRLSGDNFTSPLEASILHYMKDVYAKKRISLEDQLSIVVQDLASGRLEVAIRPRVRVKSASTIKVPILHAYMLQRFRGETKHTLENQKQLMLMIRYSNNASTNSILKILGGPEKVESILRQTHMYREISLVEYIPKDGRTYRNKISAADLNQIFVRIWFQRGIGPRFSHQKNRRASREMLSLLEMPGHKWMPDRIKDGTCFETNKSVKIWDKTGFVKGVNGNAGIVEIETPHGRKAYSIVIFMDRSNYQSIEGDATPWSAKMGRHMRRISEMTFAYFSSRYDSLNQCGKNRLIQYASRALASRPLQASL